MNTYTLSNEGRARFRRIKLRDNIATARIEGYEVLNYLYEHGSGTVEEIVRNAGLSEGYVLDKLSMFIHHGFVEKLTVM